MSMANDKPVFTSLLMFGQCNNIKYSSIFHLWWDCGVIIFKMSVFWVVALYSLVEACQCFRDPCCLCLLGVGGSNDHWNIGKLLLDYMVPQSIRQPSSRLPPCEPQILCIIFNILSALDCFLQCLECVYHCSVAALSLCLESVHAVHDHIKICLAMWLSHYCYSVSATSHWQHSTVCLWSLSNGKYPLVW